MLQNFYWNKEQISRTETKVTRTVFLISLLLVVLFFVSFFFFLLRRSSSSDTLQLLDGNSAILLASWNGHNEMIQFLLERGASVKDRATSGSTPLLYAAARGHVHTLPLLMKNGKYEKEKARERKK